MRAPSTAFPDSTSPGAAGPIENPLRGLHPMVLPVTTALADPLRTETAVIAAQIWSPLSTVPAPPSTRMPIFPLFSAALYSTVVFSPGATEPPDAEAPVASGCR